MSSAVQHICIPAWMTEGLGVTPAQNEKEPHWWILLGANTHPHQPACADIPIYFFNFAKGTELIQAGHYDAITIDSSVNLIFDWLRYKDNEPPINYCQMPAIIPQVLLPDSKLVFLFYFYFFSFKKKYIYIIILHNAKAQE